MVKKTIELDIEEAKEKIMSESITKIDITVNKVVEGILISYLLFSIGMLVIPESSIKYFIYILLSSIVGVNIIVLYIVKKAMRNFLLSENIFGGEK